MIVRHVYAEEHRRERAGVRRGVGEQADIVLRLDVLFSPVWSRLLKSQLENRDEEYAYAEANDGLEDEQTVKEEEAESERRLLILSLSDNLQNICNRACETHTVFVCSVIFLESGDHLVFDAVEEHVDNELSRYDEDDHDESEDTAAVTALYLLLRLTVVLSPEHRELARVQLLGGPLRFPRLAALS